MNIDNICFLLMSKDKNNSASSVTQLEIDSNYHWMVLLLQLCFMKLVLIQYVKYKILLQKFL